MQFSTLPFLAIEINFQSYHSVFNKNNFHSFFQKILSSENVNIGQNFFSNNFTKQLFCLPPIILKISKSHEKKPPYFQIFSTFFGKNLSMMTRSKTSKERQESCKKRILNGFPMNFIRERNSSTNFLQTFFSKKNNEGTNLSVKNSKLTKIFI